MPWPHNNYMTDWGDAYSVATNEGWAPVRAGHFADDFATERQRGLCYGAKWYFAIRSNEDKNTRYHETADGRMEKNAA